MRRTDRHGSSSGSSGIGLTVGCGNVPCSSVYIFIRCKKLFLHIILAIYSPARRKIAAPISIPMNITEKTDPIAMVKRLCLSYALRCAGFRGISREYC